MSTVLRSLILAATLALPACVTEGRFRPDKDRSAPDFTASLADLPPPDAATPEPQEPYGPPSPAETAARLQERAGERVIVRSDGRVSKFFSVRAGRGEQFRPLVLKYCELPEAAVELIPKGDIELFRDPRAPTNQPGWTPTPFDISDWLVVTGSEEEIERVERFLNLHYATVPQIEIEAKIAEVTSDNIKDLGAITDVFNAVRSKIVEDVDAATAGTQDPPPNFHSLFSQIHGSFPNSVPVPNPNAILVRAILGKTELKATLQLLASQRNVDIVSSPRIAVRNGGKAELISGDEVPYVNIQNFNPQQGTFSGGVSFKQTGVKLFIIPYLAGTDTILLNVEAEVSTPTSVVNIGGVSNPIIVTRNAKTDVHVRDGSTFVIGGLISSADTEFVKKVPLLGDIPLLGLLFRSTFTQKIYTEVLFFITPRVVNREGVGNELILP